MDTQMISDLIGRIKSEPSVLFLGQHYLRSMTGEDCFYEAVNNKLCGGNAPTETSNYKELWERINGGKPLTSTNFSDMYQVVCDIPTLDWLRSILSMRWGMVFTSAVDACLTRCVGTNFTFETLDYTKNRFRREYMSKNSLHGVFLYGAIDGNNDELPPQSCDPKTMRGLRKRVNDRISWIYDEILRDYGVLVIDGWDPESDWLSFLLENAGSMPYNSIFLFGATDRMKENETIAGLIEDGILICCTQSFAQALDDYGYFLSEEDEWGESVQGYTEGKTITIRGKNGHDSFLSIPFSSLDILDSRITLLDDDLGYEGGFQRIDEQAEDFARYLQQSSSPIWSLCTLEKGFHFSRDIDDKLWDATHKILAKQRSYRREILVLEGVSNSGKTSALIYLAMRLREEHRYPVLYISGLPTQSDFEENLKNFIKRYLLEQQDGDGYWVDNVVIIWDGNLDSDVIAKYKGLSRKLAECNVLIVGSVYHHPFESDKESSGGVVYLPVKATLNHSEETSLGQLLGKIDSDLYDRYQFAIHRVSNPNFSYILQQIAKYRYSPEWKNVIQLLHQRFSIEVDRSESDVKNALQDYQKQLKEEDVNEEIIKRGVGAAWQLKLQMYLSELQKEEGHPVAAGISSESNGIDIKKKLYEDIQTINKILAMAGQFSIILPVTFLLNMVANKGGLLGKANMFLNKLLENDSLVEYTRDEQGYPFVKFRHPQDAEFYVEKNFGNTPEQRREQEIDLLCRLIAACHWDEDESYDIVSLVRCFGPNSKGKYSEEITRGDYDSYVLYLPKIADCLKKYADDNPEAMLVYAHFLREVYTYNLKRGSKNDRDYLGDARQKLRIVLENHDQENKAQYNRLLVELCSNLVASMPRNHHDIAAFSRDDFRQFQHYFVQAVKTWNADNAGSFNQNSLLDIWLNAVCNFYGSFHTTREALNDSEFITALSDSITYIDQLLEVDLDFNSINLLNKISKVYDWSSNDSMKTICESLEKKGNDTFLYLTAHKCWLNHSAAYKNKKTGRTIEDIIRDNLFLLPDDATTYSELQKVLPELKKLFAASAIQAAAVLENGRDLIARARSSRCIHMLLRAKWLLYTGYMPLEEKQCPKLTQEQWREIYSLCDTFTKYDINEAGIPARVETLLQAVYLWAFTSEVQKARQLFSSLRQQTNTGWFVERIGLCAVGTAELRTFYVDVQRTASGRYEAKIAQENTHGTKLDMDLRGRYGIHISERMLSYLFDGQAPCSRYNIQKPVVIWFTSNGPSLGLPPRQKEGGLR